jgi:hypothetical protein
MKKKTKECIADECRKVLFQFVFWGLMALVIILGLMNGTISSLTSIAPAIDAFIEEKFNLTIFLVALVNIIVTFGIFSIAGMVKVADKAYEEMARLFYTLSTFMGWANVVSGFYFQQFHFYAKGAIIFILLAAVGLYIAWLGDVKLPEKRALSRLEVS